MCVLFDTIDGVTVSNNDSAAFSDASCVQLYTMYIGGVVCGVTMNNIDNRNTLVPVVPCVFHIFPGNLDFDAE